MRSVLRVLAAAATILASQAAASERVALVIGNAAYEGVPQLANPLNDAADNADALSEIGFSVTVVENVDYVEIRRALDRFSDLVVRAEIAIVYFAGHGIEIDRQNFLIPVDARLEDVLDVTFHAVPLDMVRHAVSPARQLSLVILDACRNNPFLQQMDLGSRLVNRGLALVTPRTRNDLVAFAAKEGKVATDGDGRNSPYAEALIRWLGEPGLEIGKFFRAVRDDVLDRTGGRQEPAVYGSLGAEDVFLNPGPRQAAAEAEPRDLASRSELTFWTFIADSDDPLDFEEYIERFPSGLFVGLARRRLAALRLPEGPSEVEAVRGHPNPGQAAGDGADPDPGPAPRPARTDVVEIGISLAPASRSAYCPAPSATPLANFAVEDGHSEGSLSVLDYGVRFDVDIHRRHDVGVVTLAPRDIDGDRVIAKPVQAMILADGTVSEFEYPIGPVDSVGEVCGIITARVKMRFAAY